MLFDETRPLAGRPASGAARWPFSVSVVIPAFNEGPRVAPIVRAVRTNVPEAEIIVVDDASSDDTADQAAAAGARVIRRPHNVGNGAGVKTGVRAAHGDVVVIIDCDGQHDPADIPRLLEHMGTYDMVIATRTNRSSHENNVRWLGNTLINRFGTYLAEQDMQDLTSGFRAMRRAVILEFLHLLPNRFSWPTTSAMALAAAGYHIRFEPVAMHKRLGGQSTQKLLKNGVRFVMIILRMTSLFAPLRVYLRVALSLFGLALLSFLVSFFITDPWRFRVPNSASALFVGAIVVFMFGLLAEQIAAMRVRIPERLDQTEEPLAASSERDL
jgi:glycosyltransferase involved in cell wall biosynthesis